MDSSIRIESDGTPQGTKVFDAVTGNEIRGVLSVEWKVDLNSFSTAKIEFVLAGLKVKNALRS